VVTSGGSFTGTPTNSGSSVGFTGTPVTGTVSVTGLSNCTGYKWQAFVQNTAGLSSPVVFNATTPNFSVENTAPTGGSVYDGNSSGVETAGNTDITSVKANWSGFSDSCSGLASTPYQVAIGTTSGGTDIQGYTSTGVTTGSPNTFTVSSLPIQTNKTYYISVKATNNVSLTTIVTSSGFTVTPNASFSLDSNTKSLGTLIAGTPNSVTSTVQGLTNGYLGYSIYAYETGLLSGSNGNIPDFSAGTYSTPALWGANTGFGYTTSCNSVESNAFSSGTKYAPFNHSVNGDVVAQNLTNVTGATYTGTPDSWTITYKANVTNIQNAGSYSTGIVYTIVPGF